MKCPASVLSYRTAAVTGDQDELPMLCSTSGLNKAFFAFYRLQAASSYESCSSSWYLAGLMTAKLLPLHSADARACLMPGKESQRGYNLELRWWQSQVLS